MLSHHKLKSVSNCSRLAVKLINLLSAPLINIVLSLQVRSLIPLNYILTWYTHILLTSFDVMVSTIRLWPHWKNFWWRIPNWLWRIFWNELDHIGIISSLDCWIYEWMTSDLTSDYYWSVVRCVLCSFIPFLS